MSIQTEVFGGAGGGGWCCVIVHLTHSLLIFPAFLPGHLYVGLNSPTCSRNHWWGTENQSGNPVSWLMVKEFLYQCFLILTSSRWTRGNRTWTGLLTQTFSKTGHHWSLVKQFLARVTHTEIALVLHFLHCSTGVCVFNSIQLALTESWLHLKHYPNAVRCTEVCKGLSVPPGVWQSSEGDIAQAGREECSDRVTNCQKELPTSIPRFHFDKGSLIKNQST